MSVFRTQTINVLKTSFKTRNRNLISSQSLIGLKYQNQFTIQRRLISNSNATSSWYWPFSSSSSKSIIEDIKPITLNDNIVAATTTNTPITIPKEATSVINDTTSTIINTVNEGITTTNSSNSYLSLSYWKSWIWTPKPYNNVTENIITPSEMEKVIPSADVTSVIKSEDIITPVVKNVSEAVETTSAIAEAAVESINASWFTPAGFFENVLFQIHEITGASWAAVLIGTTIVFRIALFPILSGTWKISIIKQLYKPLEDVCTALSNKAREYQDLSNVPYYLAMRSQLMKRTGFSLISMALLTISLAIVAISYFYAVHSLVIAGLPSLSLEGLPWCKDLTGSDNTRILPILVGLSAGFMALINFRLGATGRKYAYYANNIASITAVASTIGGTVMSPATSIVVIIVNLISAGSHILFAKSVLPRIGLTSKEMSKIVNERIVLNKYGMISKGRVNDVYKRYDKKVHDNLHELKF